MALIWPLGILDRRLTRLQHPFMRRTCSDAKMQKGCSMNRILSRAVLAGTAAIAAMSAIAPAQAQRINSQSGGTGDFAWTAQSMLVGATRTQGGIGETPYTASMPEYAGTVGLLMNGFVCSGTLLADRRSVLTAAHCVSSGGGVPDVPQNGVTAFFRNPGSGPDVQFYYGGPGYTTQQSSDVFVQELYTGDVIDHNDIAIVRLADYAPDFAGPGYELYTSEIAGRLGNITGYGSTSSIGGAVGVNTANPNRLGWFREGDNLYDFALGDERFVSNTTGVNAWAAILGEPVDQFRYSYWSDFDNGLAANDTACRITQATNFGGEPGTAFCNTGAGIREVGVAGGDSGGGGFVDGRVASVNSYGITFGTAWGDVNGALNSSWGEFTGYVPVWYHADWITARLVPTAAIPEPTTWAMMIGGFGMAGGALRRRQARTTVRYA